MDPVNKMVLGWYNVLVNLETTSGAAGAIRGLQGMGNSSELGAEPPALPIKSITGSSFAAGAAQLVAAPARPT